MAMVFPRHEEVLETINVTMMVPEEIIEQAMAETPKLDPKERIKDFTAEVELGFDEETAKRECARCLRCDVKLESDPGQEHGFDEPVLPPITEEERIIGKESKEK